jgi:hypothetical protein
MTLAAVQRMRNRSMMSLRRRCFASLLAITLVGGSTSVAFADGPNKAAADQLFDDAKKLMEAGNYKEACPKLEESQRLDPGEGTYLRLAFCYENVGRLATAWSMYREGLANAKKSNNAQRIEFATKQIAGVEPRLSKVTVVVSAPVAGLEVKWDGAAFVAGTAVPVDGGTHTITVSAPGKKTWETKIDVGAEKDAKTVNVPALEDDTTTTTTTTTTVTSSGTPTLAYVAIGAGVVFLGGAVLGQVSARSANDDRKSACADQLTPVCDDTGKSKVKTWETLSFVSAGLSVASFGLGIYLFASTPSRKEEPRTAVIDSLQVSVGAGSMSLYGAF